MSQESMPQPTAEHRMLQEHVGDWRVISTFYMDPSQPMQCEATETIEAIGPFWTRTKYECSFMGMAFVGCATLGYDAHAGHFVGSWIDCMCSVIFNYTGHYDAETKTLEMKGRGLMVQFGAECDYRMVMVFIGANSHRFEMFATPPGGSEIKMLTSEYSRA